MFDPIKVPDTLDDVDRSTFTADGITRDVISFGSGPAVIVLAEIPGITPEVMRFARSVRDRGHTVILPVLFGSPGAPMSVRRSVSVVTRACVAKEFAAFAVGRTAPITTWLTALAREWHERSGGPGVGVVGMCFTGGFALAMAVDDTVIAPVLSQPSLPLPAVRRAAARDLQLSPTDRERIADRAADGLCAMGLRFTGDSLVPAARFAALAELLGDGFIAVELDSSKGNAGGNSRVAHSVLTLDVRLDDPAHETSRAFEAVLDFLDERLGSST